MVSWIKTRCYAIFTLESPPHSFLTFNSLGVSVSQSSHSGGFRAEQKMRKRKINNEDSSDGSHQFSTTRRKKRRIRQENLPHNLSGLHPHFLFVITVFPFFWFCFYLLSFSWKVERSFKRWIHDHHSSWIVFMLMVIMTMAAALVFGAKNCFLNWHLNFNFSCMT